MFLLHFAVKQIMHFSCKSSDYEAISMCELELYILWILVESVLLQLNILHFFLLRLGLNHLEMFHIICTIFTVLLIVFSCAHYKTLITIIIIVNCLIIHNNGWDVMENSKYSCYIWMNHSTYFHRLSPPETKNVKVNWLERLKIELGLCSTDWTMMVSLG